MIAYPGFLPRVVRIVSNSTPTVSYLSGTSTYIPMASYIQFPPTSTANIPGDWWFPAYETPIPPELIGAKAKRQAQLAAWSREAALCRRLQARSQTLCPNPGKARERPFSRRTTTLATRYRVRTP